MIPENDRGVGEEQSAPRLDMLLFELALRATKLHAALLPASHIPMSWLKELATAVDPELAVYPRAWEYILETLYRHGILVKQAELGPISRAGDSRMSRMGVTFEEPEILTARSRLREFCSARLAAIRSEQQRLRNRVLTGDPDTAATAWTVPPVEEVQARAASVEGVEVFDFGDGSYLVRTKTAADWEEECLKVFVAQEFAGDDLEGVAWSLRAALLTYDELTKGAERAGKDYLKIPTNDDEAFVAALYQLSLAHKWYGEGGSCRSSWLLSGKAVEILSRLDERKPGDPKVTELLAEARKSYRAYDD